MRLTSKLSVFFSNNLEFSFLNYHQMNKKQVVIKSNIMTNMLKQLYLIVINWFIHFIHYFQAKLSVLNKKCKVYLICTEC